MRPNYNQHTYELRKKMMSYTDSMRQEETFHDLAERKPSRYRVSILGFGMQGEKITEYLALQKDNELANSIQSARAFRRKVRPISEDETGDTVEPELKTRMHQVQKGAVSGKIAPEIIEYYYLQEIYAQQGLIDYLLQAGTPNPMSDILIICPRYGFDDLDISSSGLERAVKTGNEPLANAIHKTRANLAASFPHLDSYRHCPEDIIKAMAETLADVTEEKRKIDGILKSGMEGGHIVQRDTASISDHIIGAKTLGNWLRNIDYQGFVITIPNPLDIFTYAVMSHSGLPPSRVIGINNHDETRFTYAFTKNLSKSKTPGSSPRYTFSEVNIPMFGQHNFNQRPNLMKAKFSGIDHLTGKNFYTVGIDHLEGDHLNMMMETLEFTAKEYIKNFKELPQGTAIETGDATINALTSIIMSSDHPSFRQRVAGYTVYQGRPLVDGIQARLSYRGAHQVMHWDRSLEPEYVGLTKGIEQMSWLVDRLGDFGLLDILSTEESMRRENTYSKRFQNIDYKPQSDRGPSQEEQHSQSHKKGGLSIGNLNIRSGHVNIADTIYIRDSRNKG